jgi:hypothetical protein
VAGERRSRAELGGAIAGGLVASIVLYLGVLGVGGVGDFEALQIIESVLPTSRFLASTSVGSGATVLALLLTLIGLSLNSEIEFDRRLYQRARYITVLSLVAILLGVAILLAVSIPISEVETLKGFYDVMYYSLTAALALLGGVVVTIGLMITATLVGLIHLADPRGDSKYLANDSGEAEE